MTNLEWALACAARGWLVFPSLGKKPAVKWGTESTTSAHQIELWWGARPDYDVCIKTGAESGIVVVDWDGYKLGPLAQFPLEPYPHTYQVVTPKGGHHFYFTHPGYPVANSAGTLAEYVDVRGDGGMVVAYPVADWGNRTLRPIPEAWATKRNTVTTQVAPIATPYGGDGDGLWRRASDAYKMVAAGELADEVVRRLLGWAAITAGHPVDGAQQTITSARNRGMLEPTSCVDMFWRSKGK